jgi:hypothetical protein
MNSLWSITVEDYEEVVRRAREAGLKPGDSMEAIFLDYMHEKQRKPFAHNEFTKNELLSNLAEKSGNILDISHNSEGVTEYKVIKKQKNEEEK